MKSLITLLSGFVVGVGLLLAGFYFNPLSRIESVSSLAVSKMQLYELSYSLRSSDALLLTNDGQSSLKPYPVKVQELWEPAIKNTRALVTVLSNVRHEPVGIGIKFSSDSEESKLLNAKALMNSTWHIYTRNIGSAFIEQTDNNWAYLRDVVIPARFSRDNRWQGTWSGTITEGPNALGTARVTGGTGALVGREAEAEEFLHAREYSVDTGPVDVTARLTIAIPTKAPAY